LLSGRKFCLDIIFYQMSSLSETFERAVLELVVIRLFSAVNKGECLRRHPVGRPVRPRSTLAFQAVPVRAFRRGPLPTRAPAAGSSLEARSTCRTSETFPAGRSPRAFLSYSVGLNW
jgi:hypothetical protein